MQLINWQKYIIADSVETDGLKILLFDSYQFLKIPKESVSNIIALDINNEIVWLAETPRTQFDIYHRMFINEKKLFAVSGGGELHEIDITTGKIINATMTK